MFDYKENGEANNWVITRDNDWFMVVQFNGELTDFAQREYLDRLTAHLNGVSL